jgi:hypothetical protein
VRETPRLNGGGHGNVVAALLTISAQDRTQCQVSVRIFPRWRPGSATSIGLVLLLVVSSVAWSELAFPVWVLAVSCFLTTFHAQRARTPP